LKIPPGACDCHVHVFGPAARFPFAAKRRYTPPDASVEELLALQKRLGFERVVIVHPSPYGTDNSCTLQALKQLGERARGVAVIDSGASKNELLEMQKLGVRGVRVNLETSGVHEAAAAQRLLEEAAHQVAPLGWHVQTFTKALLLKQLHLERLSVPLVIDHFGLPRDREDCEYLIRLLRTKNGVREALRPAPGASGSGPGGAGADRREPRALPVGERLAASLQPRSAPAL
jgi:predicted TIM-barrel fold metal-dependent hydrolase